MSQTRYTLIKRLQDQHDKDAWATFNETYEGYIYSVLTRIGATHDEAIDLRQDILLKLWTKLPEFEYEPKKGKFRSWLCLMIQNTTYTYFSSTGAERERIHKYFLEHPPSTSDSDPLLKLMNQEWKSYLTKQALANIEKHSSSQSISIFKRMLNGESAALLAKEFNLKENSIQRIKNRTRDKLMLEVARLREELE